MPSNIGRDRHFDQIAFMNRKNSLEWTRKAGVFDSYQTVFRDLPEDEKTYVKYMPYHDVTIEGTPRTEENKANYYRVYWRTYQMSDHFPMWVELKIDYSDEYLKSKLA